MTVTISYVTAELGGKFTETTKCSDVDAKQGMYSALFIAVIHSVSIQSIESFSYFAMSLSTRQTGSR
jgi:hypothetical protein